MEGGGPSTHQPKYKGVRLRKWGKWVSEVRLPNSRERIWLGSYDCAEKAARAFDAAQFCLRGPKANFNFPESPPNISGGQMLSPAEIQAVAARFANDYHHSQSQSQSQSSAVQEIPPQSNINSHVINVEKDETTTLLSSTNCEVVQMDTNNNNNYDNCTGGAEMDLDFYDMMVNYTNDSSGPSHEFFSDPYYLGGGGGGGVMDSLTSNLYSPPHFPQRTTPNYDDDAGNGGDEHYFQEHFLWNF